MTIETLPGMAVTVERDVPAVMRDGTVLHGDVFRPSRSGGRWPVLLSRTPYDKRLNVSTFGNAHPAWYAASGYMVVIQDSRGRYTSGGEFYPFAHEMDDGHDSVEWAAALPGCDGQVGMFGFSYVGATQLLAAVTRPPSLRSIAPGFTASQYYDGWTYNEGAPSAACGRAPAARPPATARSCWSAPGRTCRGRRGGAAARRGRAPTRSTPPTPPG